MLERQVEEINGTLLFERKRRAQSNGGFDWSETLEGELFWRRVISDDFDLRGKPKKKNRKQLELADKYYQAMEWFEKITANGCVYETLPTQNLIK